MFDIKIINGTLIDGTGEARRQADIGITGDKITAIGNLKEAESKTTIDAAGKVVSPGFIDIHTHSDLSILYDSHTNSKIHDGVTTEVVGNCGIGVAPVNPANKQLLLDYLGTRMIGSLPVKLDTHWESFADYLDYVGSHAPSVNVAPLVAQGPIRIAEMGFSKERANAEQIKNMQGMVRKAMQEGGLGLSSGLVYLPGAYTNTEELTEVTKPIKEFGGFYVTHLRSEGDDMFEALEEAITIAKGAGVPLHVSHLKLSSAKVHGQIDRLFKRIADAEAEGLEMSFDVYPFAAGMTAMTALLPSWVFEGGIQKLLERIQDPSQREKIIKDCTTGLPGWQSFSKDAGWDGVIVSTVINDSSKYLEGRTVRDIAEEMGKTPFEAVFEMLRMESGRLQVVVKMMREEDVEKIIAHPKGSFGSDGMSLSTEGLLAFGKPHPRAYATHGIILSKYVRDKQLISLETAVRKMTAMPAYRLGLDRRGLIKEGYFADVTVFDADSVKDNATYDEPKQYTTGIDKVIVNGQVVLSGGKHQEVFPGRVIGRP